MSKENEKQISGKEIAIAKSNRLNKIVGTRKSSNKHKQLMSDKA